MKLMSAIGILFIMATISHATTNYVLVVTLQNTQEVAHFTTLATPPYCSIDFEKALMQVTYVQYTNDLSLPATNKLKNIPVAIITNAIYLARQDRKTKLSNYETWDKESLIALVKVLLDEDNRWRKWLMDFKTTTSNATSLADFKIRVNALDNLPQIDKAVMIDAIKNKL